MLRIQKSCTTRSTALLLVFHWHIFLHPSQEPRAARQREGRKLQNFPSPAGKTVSKSHRGWRLLSLHTFRSSEEEGCFLEGKGGTPQGPGLLGFSSLLLPRLGTALTWLFGPEHPCSGGRWKLRGWGILPSWVPDFLTAPRLWSPPHQGSASLHRHVLLTQAKQDRELAGKTFTFTQNFASVPASHVNYQ